MRTITGHRGTAGLLGLALILWAHPVTGAEWKAYPDLGAAGWSKDKLDAAKAVAVEIRSASVMVVHHGAVVAAWGQVDRPLPLYSMRKGLYNALFGIAVAERRISLRATLAELGVEDLGGLTDREKSATVEDLLTARSGVFHPSAYEPASMKRNRPERGSSRPGERWFYNNWDFNVAASLVAEAEGRDIFALFADRIAKPLGMEDFSSADTFSFLEPSRSRYPAPIFRLSARDLARFGLLYLGRGRWEGKRILPSDWIRASWVPRSTFDAESGYGAGNGFGYLWWIFPKLEGSQWGLQRQTSVFLTRGADGQVVAVIPSMDLVVVHQTDTENGEDARFEGVTRLIQAIAGARVAERSMPKPRQLVPMRPEPLPDARPAPPRRTAVPWTRELIAGLVGEYRLNPKVRIEVHEYEGRLFALPLGAPLAEAELFLETPDRLFSPAVDLLLDVQRDSGGRAIRLTGRVDHHPAEVVRVEAP